MSRHQKNEIAILLLAIVQYSVNSATGFYSYEDDKSETYKEQKTLQKIEYLGKAK